MSTKRARSESKLRSKKSTNSRLTRSAPKVVRIGIQRHLPKNQQK